MTTKFGFVFLWIMLCIPTVSVRAYRLEVSIANVKNTPVFLAGYYGERVSVIDSAQLSASGKAIFSRDRDLCPGMYTLVIPGKLTYDLLLDGSDQQMSIGLNAANDARITGNAQASAYAEYLAWLRTQPDNRQIVERRNRMIEQHSDTFLAAYLKALQPIETDNSTETGDPGQLMKTYQERRRRFFDNMDLSDVRMLHTPLYHERIQYYISKFVTQQPDTLIHISYRMLERASGNYETFFYVSDFLIDFSLRSKIPNINKLHNFLLRNRDMVGSLAFSKFSKSKTNYFKIPDEKTLQNRLASIPLSDPEGKTFDPMLVKSKYRIFYFWEPGCIRCSANASKWQATLNKYRNKSCFGIAVNVKTDVQQPENRILAYEPLCINVSAGNMSQCDFIFFTGSYSKIIVTDTNGNILGLFGSPASLDQFMTGM